MKSKIGILTFHKALNYGANLQAYALQNFMFKLGINNEIVDYNCREMVDRYQKTIRKVKGNRIKGFIWSLSTAPTVWRKKKNTNEFVEKYLVLSRPYNAENISDADSEYRAFITGSDQVWSPTCVGFDPVYFLTFTSPAKKHSYAASVAAKEIPDAIRGEYIRRVSDFENPSLREQSGVHLISSLTGKEAHVNIDPSMLLTAEEWDKICSDEKPAEPYILLFTVPKPNRLVDYALSLAKKKNLNILYLNNLMPKKHRDAITYLEPVKITKFLSLIKNAEYICTNSFHGNAFSVLYHKQFIVEASAKKSLSSRSRDLCESLGLSDRILTEEYTPDIDAIADWNKVDMILDCERQKSAEYLGRI